jgi:hypothetical protein
MGVVAEKIIKIAKENNIPVNYHRQRRWLESIAPRRCALTALDCVRTTHLDEIHSLCRVVLAI